MNTNEFLQVLKQARGLGLATLGDLAQLFQKLGATNNREYIKDLATHNYKVSMFADAKRRSDWSDCHDYIDNLLWDLDYKHGYRLPF